MGRLCCYVDRWEEMVTQGFQQDAFLLGSIIRHGNVASAVIRMSNHCQAHPYIEELINNGSSSLLCFFSPE